MAERRMFAKTIIDSDAFLDMNQTAQLLYFHLAMRADDDGFINNPKSIMRTARCSEEDMRLLATKKFIIPFETGIVVIKHWKIHNYIAKDRYKETKYKEEKAQLQLDGNNAYTKRLQVVDSPYTERIQSVDETETQVRLGKDRLGKDSIGEDNIYTGSDEPNPLEGCMNPPEYSTEEEPEPSKPIKGKPVKHKYGEYRNVLLTDEELDKLKTKFPDWEDRIENLSLYIESKGARYKSHYATILSWARRDISKGQKSPGRGQYESQAGKVKTGSAEDLDNFYNMAAAWAQEGEGQV